MSQPRLPGFYFDENKKKYFKIQANHLVPQGAKYSRANINQENRQAKKRKTEDRKAIKRHQHTVKRSPILQNAITGGTGLCREHGTAPQLSNLDQQDAAVLLQFRPTSVTLIPPSGGYDASFINITSALYLPATQQMVVASSHVHGGEGALHVWDWDWDKAVFDFDMNQGHCLCAFNSSITSMSLAASTDEDGPRVVACSRHNENFGKMFTSLIPPPMSEPPNPYLTPGVCFQVPNSGDVRLVTSINPNTGIAAMSTAKSVYAVHKSCTVLRRLSHDNEEQHIAIDWLDNYTVVFEDNFPESGSHHIKLWDIRTPTGVVSRFKVRNRITGIVNPSHANSDTGKGGCKILASTNHHINLYDTRMPRETHKDDVPLLSFPHIHQGPQLDFTADGRNLVAAADRDNVVQIFSIRSGRLVDSLSTPRQKPHTPEHRMLKTLQWYDDPKVGSVLQACVGNDIVRWSRDATVDEEG